MSDLGMLGKFEILQNGSGSHRTVFQVFHPKPFQRSGLEMTQQPGTGTGFGKDPILHLESKKNDL